MSLEEDGNTEASSERLPDNFPINSSTCQLIRKNIVHDVLKPLQDLTINITEFRIKKIGLVF